MNKLSLKTRTSVCLAVIILVFIFAPLFSRSVSSAFWFHETFFNTLKVFENFKEKGFPTFDGETLTNDFSLLWGSILGGLSTLVSPQKALFFILARLILGGALCLSLWLFNKLIDALDFKPEKEVYFLLFSFLTALFFYTAFTGSDAALAIPCVFLNALCVLKALKKPTVISGILCGLTVSLCAFARFDSAAFFLTALLVFYFQFNGKEPVSTKQALKLLPGLIVGLVPLMFYADTLQTKFGSPVPAELLSWGKAQGMAAWRILLVVFYEPFRYAFKIPQASALITLPVLLLVLTAYISFPWAEEKQRPEDTVFYALIWYPIAYLTAIASLTFVALPEYALYPFATGAPLALLFAANKINSQITENEKPKARLTWLILGGLLSLTALSLAIKPRAAFYTDIVKTIKEFTDQNPGRYAMSTGAGITSFITGANIIRLDGMAEDLNMLKKLEAQETLRNVFRDYRINYYIAINLPKGKDCYSAREPVQNRFGGTNKGLSDWLCAEPVFEKQANSHFKISIFKIDLSGKVVSP